MRSCKYKKKQKNVRQNSDFKIISLIILKASAIFIIILISGNNLYSQTSSIPKISGPSSPCILSTGHEYLTESGKSFYTWTVSTGGTILSGGTATDNKIKIAWKTASAQTLSVKYTDGNGIIRSSDIFTVQPVPELSVVTTQINDMCFGNSTGVANVIPSGGRGEYTYLWDTKPAQTTAKISDLAAGTYNVTVTDAQFCTTIAGSYTTITIDENTCVVKAIVTIFEPSALLVSTSKIDNSCVGVADGSATAIAEGSNGPYTYSWNTNPVQNTATATGLNAGDYSVTVTDWYGCITTGNVQIIDPAPILITETHQNITCPDIADGEVKLEIKNVTPPYNILWSDGSVLQNRTGMKAGIYKVIVTDNRGCAAPLNITITAGEASFSCLNIPDIITPYPNGHNDTWVIKNIEMYPNAEVEIFNRWGIRVYSTKNISANPWDGTFKGKLVPTDSYHYILNLNDGSKPRSGVITVIR